MILPAARTGDLTYQIATRLGGEFNRVPAKRGN